jgi:hypothetical protein
MDAFVRGVRIRAVFVDAALGDRFVRACPVEDVSKNGTVAKGIRGIIRSIIEAKAFAIEIAARVAVAVIDATPHAEGIRSRPELILDVAAVVERKVT